MLNFHLNLSRKQVKELKKKLTIEEIKKMVFNNALIEIYDSTYCSMGFHSDQSLDLANESYICIFSCYNNSNTKYIRKLIIKDKITNVRSTYILEHNSIIVFPLSTNSKYLHKIILDKNGSDDIWLGITFRLSKTLINFIDINTWKTLVRFWSSRKENKVSKRKKRKLLLVVIWSSKKQHLS